MLYPTELQGRDRDIVTRAARCVTRQAHGAGHSVPGVPNLLFYRMAIENRQHADAGYAVASTRPVEATGAADEHPLGRRQTDRSAPAGLQYFSKANTDSF